MGARLRPIRPAALMMGNRGGKFHRDDKTLGKRRWASQHWICCDMHYKNMKHEAMGKGYTSLFFLDEVTALAAGHGPVSFAAGQTPRALSAAARSMNLTANFMPSALQGMRPRSADLPDGAMIEHEGKAYRGQRPAPPAMVSFPIWAGNSPSFGYEGQAFDTAAHHRHSGEGLSTALASVSHYRGTGTAADIDTALLAKAFGLNWELIHGFEGSEAEMSVLRGEIDGLIASRSSLQSFVDNGYGRILLEIGGEPNQHFHRPAIWATTDRAQSVLAIIEAQSKISRLTAGPGNMRYAGFAGLAGSLYKRNLRSRFSRGSRQAQTAHFPGVGRNCCRTRQGLASSISGGCGASERGVERGII